MRKRLVDLTYKALAWAHESKHPEVSKALKRSLADYKLGLDRYDFHHLSFGALCMLFPGALRRFGKWQVLDSLVNYDYTGTFSKGEWHFVLDDGRYRLTDDGPNTDGSLFLVSELTPGGTRIHPSDNLFVDRWREFAKECLVPGTATPLLDAIEQHDLRLLHRAILPTATRVRGASLEEFL